MKSLENKIDFIATVEVINANPNGDPLNGNSPRVNFDGYGLISDVAIKRKLRNRLQDLGQSIFVQANDRIDDGAKSLEERFEKLTGVPKISEEEAYKKVTEGYIDVRGFGQVITFGKNEKNKGLSVGVRGPISISLATSLSPVTNIDMQITRSTNGTKPKNDNARSSDTMGTKHFVEHGVYLIKGSINPFFAEKTGFSNEDVALVKEALISLFENDASSARPEGSMLVRDIYWITHPGKLGTISSGNIFNAIEFEDIDSLETFKYEDYNFKLNESIIQKLVDGGANVEHIENL